MNRLHSASPESERKQVTILFADVSGSMDMAEGQDPEQWQRIMQGFFNLLAASVEGCDGTVDKFTGDGVMAVFGAPVALEDHARRACEAALAMLDDVSGYAAELRRTHGLNFSIRVGINSGEVVAGEIGGGAYTAVGHTVGLAQRMEALAEPGSAYVGEATADLVGGFFELADLGPFEIKGASRPIRVHRLTGVGSARSRLDLARRRGFSRFVGRNAEMELLEAGLEEALSGRGAAISFVAEPGLGKSRLAHEFAQACRGRGIDVHEAQAQPQSRDTPFLPVLQLLRSYFGITDSDSERAVREKIAGRLLLLDPGFADDLPLLFDFLGVPDPDRPLPQLSPEARHRALCAAVARLVRAPNRRDPVIAVVEDLHWLDEGSDSLLGQLLSAIPGTMTLAVLNTRPEYRPPWRAPDEYSQHQLAPLGRDDSAELLGDLIGHEPSLDGVVDLLHERTAGNPFFIEEIVRDLVESGALAGERGDRRLARPIAELAVPATVQAVLAARIDRVGPDAKRLLQAASVAGDEVSTAAIEAIASLPPEDCEVAMAEAIEAGFLYPSGDGADPAVSFQHPLTRDVAYSTQLAEQRARTHAATARAIIDLNPDRHDELAGLIAHHMTAGDEPREAARWTARAAYRAGHSQPQEAQRLWAEVMDLAAELEPDSESDALALNSRLLQLDYAWRLGMDAGREARLAAEAEAIAERSEDRRSMALLLAATSIRPGRLRPAAQWLADADRAVALADEAGDPHVRVAIRAISSYALLCTGKLGAFEDELDEILEIAGHDRRTGAGIVVGSPVAWAHMGKGLARRERGRFDEAEDLFESALHIATEDGDPEMASWTRSNHALMICARGEVDAALALAQSNRELSDRLGDAFSRTLSLAGLSVVQGAAGMTREALESIEAAERIYREAIPEPGEQVPWRASIHADALLAAGRAEEARKIAGEGVAIGREHGILWSLPLSLRALGRAEAALGGDPRASLDEADRVARATGADWTRETIAEARQELGAAA